MELMAMTTNSASTTQSKKTDTAQLSQSQTSTSDKKSLSFREKLDENRLPAKRDSLGKMSPKRPAEKRLAQQQVSPNRSAAHREVDPVQRKERPKDNQNGLTEAVDSLTRRAALQSFIRKMKQDLNVNPTEIVSAFMALPPDQMKLPPQMNIDSIVNQLNLDPVAAEKASIYFDQMLADTSANSIADYLKGSSRQLSLEVMSQSERRKALMENSIDSMNNQFFSSPRAESIEAEALKADSGGESESRSEPGMILAGLGAGAAGLGAAINGFAQNAGSGAGAAASATGQTTAQTAQAFAQIANQGQGLDLGSSQVQNSASEVTTFSSESGQLLDQMQGFEVPKAAVGAAGLAAYGVSSAGKPAGSTMAGLADSVDTKSFEGSSSNDLFAGMTESSDSESDASDLDFSESGMASDQQIDDIGQEVDGSDNIQFSVRAEQAKPGEKVSNVTNSFQVDVQPTEAENAKNVRDIVEQTQFLMKKGGGEAKVILNPEGMGQINLKVSTEGDQVSVDMVTESAEAKKLIEKGLGDLKATLASHKLNVENMKVDMAGEIAKQFDHAHDEAQRQSAQHFMENFRQENGSWRQGFFDIPGVRAPGNQGSEDGLTLESLKSNEKKSNRRLDLVA